MTIGTCSVLLDNRTPYVWETNGHCAVKGYAWYNGELLQSGGLAMLLGSLTSGKEAYETVSQLNGCFAAVLEVGGAALAFCDRLRSFPLFYTLDGKYITDKVSMVLDLEPKYSGGYDYTGIAEVICSGMFTLEQRTFFKDIKSIDAGAYLKVSPGGEPGHNFYYTHTRKAMISDNSGNSRFKEIEEMSDRVFERLISSLNNKTAIIPLSGGYDSRYIVCMLKKLGYQDVVCYTYGVDDGNYETQFARKVAAGLGYPCFYAEISDKFSCGVLDEADYISMAHNYSSAPHLQEVLVLKELRNNPAFPKEGVVIPGFCGDLLGGSYILSAEHSGPNVNLDPELVKYIYLTHLNRNKKLKKYKSVITSDIDGFLNRNCAPASNPTIFNDNHESWFTVHKVSKFIVNSLRVYEFYGYEWRMPLWDNEITEYWYGVPNELRQNKKLYNDSLFALLFKPYNVDFVKPHDSHVIKKRGNVSVCVRRLVWWFITNMYFRFGVLVYPLSDHNKFLRVAVDCYKRIKHKRLADLSHMPVNEILALWFVEKLLPDMDYNLLG